MPPSLYVTVCSDTAAVSLQLSDAFFHCRVLAVMIEPGGEFGESVTGGTAAAPVASELFSYWLQRTPARG